MKKKLIDVLQYMKEKRFNKLLRQKFHFQKIELWCIIIIKKVRILKNSEVFVRLSKIQPTTYIREITFLYGRKAACEWTSKV